VDGIRREITGEVIEESAFAIERMSWLVVVWIVVFGRAGEWVVGVGGSRGVGAIGLGRGVDDVYVHWLSGPESRDDEVAVRYV
jgi:hypothetical protein